MAEKIRVVTLENLEPKLACYNLDHASHKVARVFPQVTELKNGTLHGVFVQKLLPDSVTFLAREIKTLPATVLECDEIKSALAPNAHGVKPRLRQRGDVLEADSAEAAPAAQDSPPEVVNSAAKRSRDAARVVTSPQANVEKGQG